MCSDKGRGDVDVLIFGSGSHPADCWNKYAQSFRVPSVPMCQPVCVDVPSETEAVLGTPMKLTCIACLRREEIKAKTRVDWYYMPTKEQGVTPNRTHVGCNHVIQ